MDGITHALKAVFLINRLTVAPHVVHVEIGRVRALEHLGVFVYVCAL